MAVPAGRFWYAQCLTTLLSAAYPMLVRFVLVAMYRGLLLFWFVVEPSPHVAVPPMRAAPPTHCGFVPEWLTNLPPTASMSAPAGGVKPMPHMALPATSPWPMASPISMSPSTTTLPSVSMLPR